MPLFILSYIMALWDLDSFATLRAIACSRARQAGGAGGGRRQSALLQGTVSKISNLTHMQGVADDDRSYAAGSGLQRRF